MQVADSSTTLSPVQAQVIAALAQGRTVTAAAQNAGVHRNTIYNWLNEPTFQTAADEAQTEYVAILSDGMRDLAALALENLRSLLEDPKTPPAVRLRTALSILQRPHFPNRGWHLPERIEPPQEQQVVDNLAEIKADYDAMRMTEAMQPDQPIARCSPCPCGSGIKYKRCCGAASPGKRNPPNSAQGVRGGTGDSPVGSNRQQVRLALAPERNAT
jgi:Helix-turn-helix domain/SEC-C motif